MLDFGGEITCAHRRHLLIGVARVPWGVLVLTAEVEDQRARCRAGREAGDAVKSAPVGPSVIVVKGLTKVVPIAQDRTGDFTSSRVDGLERKAAVIGVSRPNFRFASELVLQLRHHGADSRGGIENIRIFSCFSSDPGTLESGKRPFGIKTGV